MTMIIVVNCDVPSESKSCLSPPSLRLEHSGFEGRFLRVRTSGSLDDQVGGVVRTPDAGLHAVFLHEVCQEACKQIRSSAQRRRQAICLAGHPGAVPTNHSLRWVHNSSSIHMYRPQTISILPLLMKYILTFSPKIIALTYNR